MNCFFGHKYGDWNKVMEADTYDDESKLMKGKIILQARICVRCKFIDFYRDFVSAPTFQHVKKAKK